MLRRPKGHTNAVRNDARKRAVPPTSWEDIPVNAECSLPFKVAAKLIKKGEHYQEVASKISKRFNLPMLETFNICDYWNRTLKKG